MHFSNPFAPTLLVLLLAVISTSHSAVVRSMEDGPWNDIEWEGGVPMEGDTVVVRNTVVAPQSTPSVHLEVGREGTFILLTGLVRVRALINRGRVELGPHTLLLVDGRIDSEGWIRGDGTIGLHGDGARLRASNPVGNLLITGVGVGHAVVEGDCACSSLVIDADRRLSITGGGLTVMGSYVDRNGPFAPGIDCPDGPVHLRGSVSGSARGAVWLEGRRLSTSGRQAEITITGRLGDPLSGVVVTADRVASGAVMVGTLIVDIDAALTGRGLSGGGTNWIDGTAIILGKLASTEADGRWVVADAIRNFGVISSTTLRFTRPLSRLDASTGLWENDVSVEYVGHSGDTLVIIGNPILSHLTIAALDPTDTGVVVHVADGSLRVRHEFRSDTARRCRLVGESVIRLGGRVSGIVDGDVQLDGFRGSEVSGIIGSRDRRVTISSPKRIVGKTLFKGEVDLLPWGRLEIAGRCILPDSTTLRGRIIVDTAAELHPGRFVRLVRGGEGGGVIAITTDTRLEIGESLIDSLGIDVGPGGLLRTEGAITIPRLHIRIGGELDHRVGDIITTTRSFTREIAYPEGFSLGSSAVDPFDFSPDSVFIGSIPPIYAFNGGYIPATSITPGIGYYVRYSSDDTVLMRGRFVNYPLAIPVHAGWNLVGGGSVAADVSDIVAIGTTIETPFYGSSAGTGQATTLQPGRGYWVRVSSDGELVIGSQPSVEQGDPIPPLSHDGRNDMLYGCHVPMQEDITFID